MQRHSPSTTPALEIPVSSPGRRHLFAVYAAAIVFALAGCQCNCSNTIKVGDGGTGGGGQTDGGAGGTGGGAGSGGGTGGSGGGSNFDAGGIVDAGFGPGTITLDGGLGGEGTGVKLDTHGWVVLNQGTAEFHFMWIANDSQGWVSKYDTRTGKEVGRYISVIPKDCQNSPNGPPCAGGQVNGVRGDVTNHPSRTAIDLLGDVWVANRAQGLQGSVTKIANDTSSCIDRNGNGTIETSRDLNGDGQISTNPADGEMIIPTDYLNPNQYDECVLFSTPLGGVGADVAARAIAVSAGLEGSAGDVWVGIYREQRFYRLRATDGQPVAVNTAGAMWIDIGFGAYGAIVDRLQRLWAVQPGTARLALIDTTTGTLITDQISAPASANCASYAIGIDGKNRVWVPGWSTGARACRYDHATGVWTPFDFTTAHSQIGTTMGYGRGIAVDNTGQVYMSGWSGTQAALIRFDAETGAIIPFNGAEFIDASDANTAQSIGVGLDADGHPWVNNASGNAMKIDKVTGAITRTANQGAYLYTYSDFTGYQLRNFTAPRGTYRNTFTGCDNQTQWLTLTWDAVMPPNTNIQAYVKVADTLAALNAPTLVRYGPFSTSPADLQAAGVPRATMLRVEFVLTSTDGVSTPALKSYDVQWACGGIIN